MTMDKSVAAKRDVPDDFLVQLILTAQQDTMV